jgi:hypothetical protein
MIAARTGEPAGGVETSARDIFGGVGSGFGLTSCSIRSLVHGVAWMRRA